MSKDGNDIYDVVSGDIMGFEDLWWLNNKEWRSVSWISTDYIPEDDIAVGGYRISFGWDSIEGGPQGGNYTHRVYIMVPSYSEWISSSLEERWNAITSNEVLFFDDNATAVIYEDTGVPDLHMWIEGKAEADEELGIGFYYYPVGSLWESYMWDAYSGELQVEYSVPPSIILPGDGAMFFAGDAVELEWTDTRVDNLYYRVCYSSTEDFSSDVHYVDNISENNPAIGPFYDVGRIYWKVQVYGNDTETSWVGPKYFEIIPKPTTTTTTADSSTTSTAATSTVPDGATTTVPDAVTTTTAPEGTTTTTVTVTNSKAIIVAGGGPYEGNELWEATEMLANYAYKVLLHQGFSPGTIMYLTENESADADDDGTVDCDGDPTNDSLEYALTDWAADVDNVILFLTDHGGDGTFIMSENEILYADQLDKWLDDLQEVNEVKVTVIYDACKSGSFLPLLAPPAGKQRILISSSSAEEPAYFVTQGTVSFSRYLWSNVFDGLELYESFTIAKSAMETPGYQSALLDDDGNGVGNEKGDGNLARGYIVGAGNYSEDVIPTITHISEEQTLSGETSATIWVDGVSSSGTVVMVWGLVKGPDSGSDSSDVPVTDLPPIVLTQEVDNRYKGIYEKFTTIGTYNIAVYAMDDSGKISLPKVTIVHQTLGKEVEDDDVRRKCLLTNILGKNDPGVETLREFRDEVLARNLLGRKLIELYYKNEGGIISILDRHPTVKKNAKVVLESLVPVMEKFFKK